MTGPVRVVDGTRPLEKQRQLLYINQNGHLPRVQSGVGDRGPGRANGSVPLVWFGASDSDRHFLTGKGGCPTVRRAPISKKPIARPSFPVLDPREGGLSIFLAP